MVHIHTPTKAHRVDKAVHTRTRLYDTHTRTAKQISLSRLEKYLRTLSSFLFRLLYLKVTSSIRHSTTDEATEFRRSLTGHSQSAPTLKQPAINPIRLNQRHYEQINSGECIVSKEPIREATSDERPWPKLDPLLPHSSTYGTYGARLPLHEHNEKQQRQ